MEVYWTVCAFLTGSVYTLATWHSRQILGPVRQLLDLRCFMIEHMSDDQLENLKKNHPENFGLQDHFAFLDWAKGKPDRRKILETIGTLLEEEDKKLLGEEDKKTQRRSHHITQKDLMKKVEEAIDRNSQQLPKQDNNKCDYLKEYLKDTLRKEYRGYQLLQSKGRYSFRGQQSQS